MAEEACDEALFRAEPAELEMEEAAEESPALEADERRLDCSERTDDVTLFSDD